MDGCTCGRCSVYSAPEVLCKGALLKLYIAEAKKAQSLENELDKHAKGKGK